MDKAKAITLQNSIDDILTQLYVEDVTTELVCDDDDKTEYQLNVISQGNSLSGVILTQIALFCEFHNLCYRADTYTGKLEVIVF